MVDFIKAVLILTIVLLSIQSRGQGFEDTTMYSQVLENLREDQFENAFSALEKLKVEYSGRKTSRSYIQFLLDAAYILNEKGNYEPSLSYYFYILELCSSSDEFKTEETKALLDVGLLYYFLGLPELSLEYTNKALKIARADSHAEYIATAINQIGLYYEKTGNYNLALKEFRESLNMHKELNNIHGQSTILGNMGIVYEKLNRYDDAMKYQLESLALDDSIGNASGVAWSHQIRIIAYKNEQT